MSQPPPPLRDWSKKQLIREVERLRAILHEHSEQLGDAPRSGGDLVDTAGDPYGRGTVLIDSRHAVLMDEIDVSLVDTKQDERPAMALLLQGRVNLTSERTRQLYLFGPDGAAGLVSEILELGHRAGDAFEAELKASLEQRLENMP